VEVLLVTANKECDVVVLAAGMGTRLAAVSGGMPKALLDVAGCSLLDRALSFATSLSPHGKHIVVAGFELELFRQHHASTRNSHYLLVENERYRDGSVYSVRSALTAVSNDMYLINADHIFPPDSYHHFRSHQLAAISVFCDHTRTLGADDMKVQTYAGTRNVSRISKALSAYDYGYIGVTYVPRSQVNVYRKAIDDTVKQVGPTASAEAVIQLMANRGDAIHCILADNIAWYEVDTPEDYQLASMMLKGCNGRLPDLPQGQRRQQ
jgi:choline kinase